MTKKLRIGIRREDKNQWERRVPLIPEHVASLVKEHGIEVMVQPSPIRAYSDEQYKAAGATISEDLSECPIVFAVKEIPASLFVEGSTYIYFSHTLKGQPENMPMLQTLLDKGCQLVDYEKITDDNGRRLIFFGKHAGLVGMINTLWSYGRRVATLGMDTPFGEIKQALEYDDLKDAKAKIAGIGDRIRKDGLPKKMGPVICGFAGYGNVSLGAQEIYDLLPVKEVQPDALADLAMSESFDSHAVYKVVFKEEHLVRPIDPNAGFVLQDYYDHPEKYQSRFEEFLPYLTLLVNCIYWTPSYPRLVTFDYLKKASIKGDMKLQVIGDISCDINGSIEATVKATDSGNPVYMYNGATGEITDGVEDQGVVLLTTDNLPCELPKESSSTFSKVLVKYVPGIVNADYSASLEQAGFPDEIRRAIMVWQGKLTPDYKYLQKNLTK